MEKRVTSLTGGSGGSRLSYKWKGGGGGWAGHPDPEIRGARSQKKFFRPLGPQFGLKIRGGLAPLSGPFPESVTVGSPITM